MTSSPLQSYDPARGGSRALELEADLLRTLAAQPPWAASPAHPRADRGLRASFRRWAPPALPSVAMLQAVYDMALRRPDFQTLHPDQQDAAATRLAAALHLFSRLPESARSARSARSVGDACAGSPKGQSVLSNTRFARLLNTPPDPALRTAALSRVFRQLDRASIGLAPDDAHNLLRFLFHPEPEPAVRRWAGDYFRIRTPRTAPPSDPAAPELTPDTPTP